MGRCMTPCFDQKTPSCIIYCISKEEKGELLLWLNWKWLGTTNQSLKSFFSKAINNLTITFHFNYETRVWLNFIVHIKNLDIIHHCTRTPSRHPLHLIHRESWYLHILPPVNILFSQVQYHFLERVFQKT